MAGISHRKRKLFLLALSQPNYLITAEDGMMNARVARDIGGSVNAAGQLIGDMEREGLLSRDHGPRNLSRRTFSLPLTPKGEKLATELLSVDVKPQTRDRMAPASFKSGTFGSAARPETPGRDTDSGSETNHRAVAIRRSTRSYPKSGAAPSQIILRELPPKRIGSNVRDFEQEDCRKLIAQLAVTESGVMYNSEGGLENQLAKSLGLESDEVMQLVRHMVSDGKLVSRVWSRTLFGIALPNYRQQLDELDEAA
jgi:DNA-binding MarR family transcriptional regulator